MASASAGALHASAPPPPGPARGLPAAQATRHMGIRITTLQYASLCASMPVLAAVSLPLDGTDWAAQLGAWGTADWCVLVVLGSVVFLGLAFALQVNWRGPGTVGELGGRAALTCSLKLPLSCCMPQHVAFLHGHTCWKPAAAATTVTVFGWGGGEE